ncbi:hypothetical protein [Streptomyces tsukubensis]|uniref:hypothetical protein n=1 Tax=Streptomyces tsukubensis TaxID=83656 RepID=UPI0015C2D3C6|nr:hypothetical protein [Streptomyces tsukubensis]
MEIGRSAILSATDGADHVEAELKASEFLNRACPEGAPGNSGRRTRWILGCSELRDGTGSVLGYTMSLAWVTAGVVTNSVVYVSSTRSLRSATLSGPRTPRHEAVRESGNAQNTESALNVSWSVPAGEQLQAVETAITEFGYRITPAQSAVLALLDTAEGRSAGFVGRVADPAARLAASLLISEAHGQIGDWSGGYPGLYEDSVVAGSHFTHYQRLARILAAADQSAPSALGVREVSRNV